jgi:hypothetical protein
MPEDENLHQRSCENFNLYKYQLLCTLKSFHASHSRAMWHLSTLLILERCGIFPRFSFYSDVASLQQNLILSEDLYSQLGFSRAKLKQGLLQNERLFKK